MSEVDLATGKEVKEIRGRPAADRGVPGARRHADGGQLQRRHVLADRHQDGQASCRPSTSTRCPGSTVGSYPTRSRCPIAGHILVSIGRDNALAVYDYHGPRTPVRTRACCPPTSTRSAWPTTRPSARSSSPTTRASAPADPRPTTQQGPGYRPGAAAGQGPQHLRRHRLGHRVHDAQHGGARRLHPPGVRRQRLGRTCWPARPLRNCSGHAAAVIPAQARLPVADQARVPDHPGEPHLRPGPRRHRQGQQRPARWPSSATRSLPTGTRWPTTSGCSTTSTTRGRCRADGHNWIVQADANDYIEKEFGAFYRSYPAQGGDALAYQRDGFIWNAAEAAGPDGQGLRRVQQLPDQQQSLTRVPTWSAYYQDSQILEGKATGTAAGAGSRR